MDNKPDGFFAVVLELPDGTFKEWGGRGRSWASRRELSAERAGRRMTLIKNYAEGEPMTKKGQKTAKNALPTPEMFDAVNFVGELLRPSK